MLALGTSRSPIRRPVPTKLCSSIRVLVIDDDRTLREGCASLLQVEGYNVSTCGRGDEAIELVRRAPFDIVLVDLCMTPVSGMEILKAALEARPRHDRHHDDGQPERRVERRSPAHRRVGLPAQAVLRNAPPAAVRPRRACGARAARDEETRAIRMLEQQRQQRQAHAARRLAGVPHARSISRARSRRPMRRSCSSARAARVRR